MNRFNNREELVEAAARQQHEANLSAGGVFIELEDGRIVRHSDIDAERKVADREVQFVSGRYAHLEIDGIGPCRDMDGFLYINGVGYCRGWNR